MPEVINLWAHQIVAKLKLTPTPFPFLDLLERGHLIILESPELLGVSNYLSVYSQLPHLVHFKCTIKCFTGQKYGIRLGKINFGMDTAPVDASCKTIIISSQRDRPMGCCYASSALSPAFFLKQWTTIFYSQALIKLSFTDF